MRLSLLIVSICLIGCAGSGLPTPSDQKNPGKVLPFAIRSYDIKVSADPGRERLSMHVRMKLDNGALRSKLRFLFTRPSVVNGVYAIVRQKPVPLKYTFKPSPNPVAFWRTELIVTVTNPTPEMYLVFEYRYDKKSFRGYAPNPTTSDNLHLGQVTRSSIYSSHLSYYPQHLDKENGFHETARLSIECPAGWMGVSSAPVFRRKISSCQTRVDDVGGLRIGVPPMEASRAASVDRVGSQTYSPIDIVGLAMTVRQCSREPLWREP